MLTQLESYGSYLKAMWTRLQILREDDQGMTTETLIITATLVVAAMAALAIITTRIGNEADLIEG